MLWTCLWRHCPFVPQILFASLVVLLAKIQPMIFSSSVIPYLELQLTAITHLCAVAMPINHKINDNLTPFIEEWLVLPPLRGESRSVQLLCCVHHVWAKERNTGLSNLKTQQQWESGDTHVRFRALLTPETAQSTSSLCPCGFLRSNSSWQEHREGWT